MIYVEIKTAKTKNGLELIGQLPQNLANANSLEILTLKDGLFLLTIKGAVEKTEEKLATPRAGQLSENEKNVIRKLLSIRFEKRVPAEVDKTLSKEEKEILDVLIKKRQVWVFFGNKYGKDGVYNIADSAFSEVREQEHVSTGTVQQNAVAHNVSPTHPPEKLSWLVLENESDARNFGHAFEEKIKNGLVRGLRAFDRKYYFISKEFADEMEPKAMVALSSGDKTAEELSREIKISSEGCRALLIHLAEAGEVLEKQKGKYAKA